MYTQIDTVNDVKSPLTNNNHNGVVADKADTNAEPERECISFREPWGFKLRSTTVKLFLLLFSVWDISWNLSTVQNGKVKDQIAVKSPTVVTAAAVEGPEHVLDFFRDIKNATAGGLADSLELARDINSIAARYLILEPRAALQSIVPPVVDIDCDDPLYTGVLTGNTATQEKYMIDIVPFGFDVDYLEIRLMEYFDLVDKFVSIEQSTSFKGVPKKILIPELLESDHSHGSSPKSSTFKTSFQAKF
jgi:hypothetical protein